MNSYKELKTRLNYLVKISKIKKKKIAFLISNTAKYEKVSYYLTPVRETVKYLHTGVVLFSNKVSKEICKIIDGKVDIIFVDTEKKSYSNKKNDIVNVERSVKENVHKSKLRFYKANDLTVNAAEEFLNIHYRKDIRNISGKKILIIGAGNIGFKLALKLVERGSNIFLNRRDNTKLKKICDTINFVKPIGTFAKAKPIKKYKNKLDYFDIIFCATNNQNIISFKDISNLKKNVLIIDIGKGMFDAKTLDVLIQNNIKVYRLDVEMALNILVDSSNIFFKHVRKTNYIVNKKNNFTFLSNGILGRKNDIITDNPINPKKIYGICDGKGDFMRLNSNQKKKFEKKIKLITKFNVRFH